MATSRVLILDGEQKSALAATRSLGKRGIQVIVGSNGHTSLAGMSKYCSRQIQYPSPYNYPHLFIEKITETIKALNVSMILPMTDITVHNILKHRKFFSSVKIPPITYCQYLDASDKIKLVKHATKIGIPVPESVFIDKIEEVYDILPDLRFPLVIKPKASLITVNNKIVKKGVRIVNNADELLHQITTNSAF